MGLIVEVVVADVVEVEVGLAAVAPVVASLLVAEEDLEVVIVVASAVIVVASAVAEVAATVDLAAADLTEAAVVAVAFNTPLKYIYNRI